MKIVWTRQYGDKGDTPVNPIIVSISLNLKVEFNGDRPAGPYHQRWNARFIEPHYSVASDFPWRWYGLDGGGHNPNCGVPLLKESNKDVGSIEIITWCEEGGKRIPGTTLNRIFYVRNATEEERKAAKDARWGILFRNIGRVVSVRCADGKIPVDRVWITLINEFLTSDTIVRGMLWYRATKTISEIEFAVEWAKNYLSKKLENPEYDTDIDEDVEPIEEDETDPDTKPDPVEEIDTDAILRLLRDIENDVNKIEELLPK